jgi:hypothetical protein
MNADKKTMDFRAELPDSICLANSSTRLFRLGRWKALANNSLIEAGQRAYFATWRQNRERMNALRDVLTGMRHAGIECMVLKEQRLPCGTIAIMACETWGISTY